MKKTLSIIPILALIALTSCFAQKVNVDPNVRRQEQEPPAPPVETIIQNTRYDPAKDPDTRMATKVTFEALHTRLGTAIADLSKATGVGIRCGNSKNDWSVRDIPITIYAKDIALGKLLRTIAHATYTVVGSSKSKDVIVYQIFRDQPRLNTLKGDPVLGAAASRAQVSRDWDAAVSLKDFPDDQVVAQNASPMAQPIPAFHKKLAVLLAAMGPEYKHQALDGKPIVLRVSSAPAALREPLRATIKAGFDAYTIQRGRPDDTPKEFAPEQIDNAALVIRSVFPEAVFNLQATVQNGSYRWGDSIVPSYGIKINDPKLVQKLQATLHGDIKSQPRQPDVDTTMNLDLPKSLPYSKGIFADNKISLEDLKGKARLNGAEVAYECAKRGSFSIVLEDWDYMSHDPRTSQEALRKDITISDALRSIGGHRWYADDVDLVVLGQSTGWVGQQRDLVPASFLDDLRAKLGSSGVDLDDVLPIAYLTSGQYFAWIVDSKDLRSIPNRCSQLADDPMWQFFASLPSEDRAMAASDIGLPLAKCNAQAVLDALTRAQKRGAYFNAGSSTPQGPDLADANLIPKLTLHLKVTQIPFRPDSYRTGAQTRYIAPKDKPVPRGLDYVCRYELNITTADSTQGKALMRCVGPHGLPFYSEDREDELIKSVMGTTSIN